MQNFPKVSVVIPLFNAENYVGQLLKSILNQTFQDFEVIVIDDCSTDNSNKVVKKFIPEFDGKLKLIKSDKNSGEPAVPRNIGMDFSTGKYVAFIDDDDILLPDALELWYEAAEEYQADVVHAEKHLIAEGDNENINSDTKFKIASVQMTPLNDEITVVTDDVAERINLFNKKQFWYTWNKLFRREFLIKNQLKFPTETKTSDDMLFSFFTLFLAKKYVRIPNFVNIYRVRQNSLSHDKISMESHAEKWTNILIKVVRRMSEFMEKQEFFQQNPEYKFIALQIPVHDLLNFLILPYNNVSMFKLAAILHKQFENNPCADVLLMSYIFNLASNYHVQLFKSRSQFSRLQKQINDLKAQLENK